MASSTPNPTTSTKSSCGISTSKHQKLANEERVDRISNLPDSILVHILSFLPTKDAVKTGVLSKKRWESLWTKVLNFDFNDWEVKVPQTQSFNNFVYRVLLQHNAPSIHKFRLQRWRNRNSGDVESWLLMVVAKNVQEIYLDGLGIHLPQRVLTCKTITFLELSGETVIKFPAGSSCFCFPSLKTLHLHYVYQMDDKTFRKLISSCSVLENLSVQRGGNGMDEVRRLTISSPTLKALKVEHLDDENMINPEREVEINAEALEYLCINDHTSEFFFLTNIESLVEAHVSIGLISAGLRRWKNIFRYPQLVVESFAAFRNVKFLCLSGHTSLACGLGEQLSSTKFWNLTHLALGTGCFVWLQLLPSLLESSDNLQFLKFAKDFQNDITLVKRSWIDPEHEPRCLSRSLREISVGDFLGSDDELAVLKYLLKKGRVLETLEINPTVPTGMKEVDLETKLHLLHQKISKFTRGSETCKITFS